MAGLRPGHPRLSCLVACRMGGAKRYPSLSETAMGFAKGFTHPTLAGSVCSVQLSPCGRGIGRLDVIARSAATKQSILSLRGAMDCFAALAMTVSVVCRMGGAKRY